MAEFNMSRDITLSDLVCEVHDCKLLPLYCMDCDCPLCGDCVTCNHVGHKVQKVSQVVETQLRQLEESLSNDNSVLFLRELLNNSESRQKHFRERSESLLRNVVDREKEIIEKVKLWRENMTETIITLTNNEEKKLEKDKALASALLMYKEKKIDFEISHECVKIIALNCGLKKLLTKDNRILSCLQSLDFRVGIANDNLFCLFGKLIDETEELSSDIYQCGEEEEEEEEEEFYDSLDLKVSVKFDISSNLINNIVPLQNSTIIVLNKGTVYDYNLKTGDLKHRPTVLKDVLQIVLIPSCDDVLSLMKDRKCIKRISSGSMVTTYMSTKLYNEEYECVGPGGEQAYACVVHRLEINKCRYFKISLSDEFGRILMTFTSTIDTFNSWYSRILATNVKNAFVKISSRSVTIVFAKGDTYTGTKNYNGSVGTSPSSAFYPTDIAVDRCGNILVSVHNDNAIHLLDKTLTFQKLLMTEEDGLYRPTSVALDSEGYLYVGCENGQIHVVNYQYLLNTNRLTRLKFQKLSSKGSSLNFPGNFCQKTFDKILKNYNAEK